MNASIWILIAAGAAMFLVIGGLSMMSHHYTIEIWKRFRKWGGMPTGITQNVKVRPDRALCKAV